MSRTILFLLSLALSVGAIVAPAHATLLLSDNFDSDTLGTTPPVAPGGPWSFMYGVPPVVVDPAGGPNQVLKLSSGGYNFAYLDFTPGQQSAMQAGMPLQISFDLLQPSTSSNALAIGLYNNSFHDFSNAAIDLEFLKSNPPAPRVGAYNPGTNAFDPVGTLAATGNWDHVAVRVDLPDHVYSVTLNGSTVSNVAFTSNQATIQELGFGDPTSVGSLGYIDNLTVSLVPEPSSVVMAGLAFTSLGLLLRRRASAKS